MVQLLFIARLGTLSQVLSLRDRPQAHTGPHTLARVCSRRQTKTRVSSLARRRVMISGGGRASAAGVCASNEAPKELSLPSL